jgi:hypothetical protein
MRNVQMIAVIAGLLFSLAASAQNKTGSIVMMKKRLLVFLFLLPAFGLVSAWAQKPKDATIVDPEAHQVVFENDHVRVIDARAAHRWKSAMHSHPPMLVINLGSGRQKVTWPNGKTQIVDLNPGVVVVAG